MCFNTQPPEGGWIRVKRNHVPTRNVSTHSRPKAAGFLTSLQMGLSSCFNTQPPEGGWLTQIARSVVVWKFQHTAARRRLVLLFLAFVLLLAVSTHSRPKAAGWSKSFCHIIYMGFNTQPPEGGWP